MPFASTEQLVPGEASTRPLLVVFATMDPRGNKIGGVETHIRHILRNHPTDTDLILAGIDEAGDLKPGIPLAVDFGGRSITFVPLTHVAAEEAGRSASRLARSTTLRFVLGGIRHIGALRRLVRGRQATADLPRVEFAVLPLLMGLPFALTVHSDLGQANQTDSLLKQHRGLKSWSEALAFRFASHVFFVNAGIRNVLIEAHPRIASKSSLITVPVDSARFQPSPFPDLGRFRLVYAGRFDEVKDPALMFETIARVGAALDGQLQFDMIGSADPEAFSEFAAIRHMTVRHGPKDSDGVAAVIRQAHCGIMTSHSEGMPAFLLETLASGRAFGSVHMPSFEPLVVSGLSGKMVDRASTRAESAERLAEAFLGIRQAIMQGHLDPMRIADLVAPYSVASILGRLFDQHAVLRKAAAMHKPGPGLVLPMVIFKADLS